MFEQYLRQIIAISIKRRRTCVKTFGKVYLFDYF